METSFSNVGFSKEFDGSPLGWEPVEAVEAMVVQRSEALKLGLGCSSVISLWWRRRRVVSRMLWGAKPNWA
jgi:hypothetical protein